MDYEEKLTALEHLKDITAKYVAGGFTSVVEAQTIRQELLETYGNVSDVFEFVVGKQRIEVPLSGSGGKVSYYPNFFEAGFMSGRTFHTSQGQSELFKVIGRVRELAKNSQRNTSIVKPKPMIAEKFNVYISTFMGSFNLFDLTEEKLEKLVEAYHMGKDSVTLSGTKYIISNISSVQIYTHNSNGISNPEEYLAGQGLLVTDVTRLN